MPFTAAERAYLDHQLIGRLATVDARGAPQNNPVGFAVDDETGDLLVGGIDLTRTRKFRNIRRHPAVAFVVDEVVSTSPWTVRGIEIRGTAEALSDVDPPRGGRSRSVIRIHPEWIGSWGIEPGASGMSVRRPALSGAAVGKESA